MTKDERILSLKQQGKTLAEIAETIGMSVSTVKRIVSKTKEQSSFMVGTDAESTDTVDIDFDTKNDDIETVPEEKSNAELEKKVAKLLQQIDQSDIIESMAAVRFETEKLATDVQAVLSLLRFPVNTNQIAGFLALPATMMFATLFGYLAGKAELLNFALCPAIFLCCLSVILAALAIRNKLWSIVYWWSAVITFATPFALFAGYYIGYFDNAILYRWWLLGGAISIGLIVGIICLLWRGK